MLLAACGPTAPVTVPGLEAVMGRSLIGVVGKTADDKERISIRTARECAAGLWKAECGK